MDFKGEKPLNDKHSRASNFIILGVKTQFIKLLLPLFYPQQSISPERISQIHLIS